MAEKLIHLPSEMIHLRVDPPTAGCIVRLNSGGPTFVIDVVHDRVFECVRYDEEAAAIRTATLSKHIVHHEGSCPCAYSAYRNAN